MQDTVDTIVSDMLKWPHRIVVPIGGIPVDLRLHNLSFVSLCIYEIGARYLLVCICSYPWAIVFFPLNKICSELELKPQGKLTLTVVKANSLKNMEMIGKSDPYAVVHIRPLFKYKTKTVENNLNPVWNEEFELIVEDKETQSVILEVLNLYSLFLFFVNVHFFGFSPLFMVCKMVLCLRKHQVHLSFTRYLSWLLGVYSV